MALTMPTSGWLARNMRKNGLSDVRNLNKLYNDEIEFLNPGMVGGGSVPAPPNPKPVTTPRSPLPMPQLDSSSPTSLATSKGGTLNTTPSLTLPTYDEGKVESLAQRFSAPGIRNLRTSMQDVQQGYYENPNVKAKTLRDALSGYGQGLENVMAGALKEGEGVYGQQWGAAVNKATAEFSAAQARDLQANSLAAQQAMQASTIASNEKLNKYNNEWKAYLASLS